MADEPMTDERLAKIRERVAADVTLLGTLIPPWELAGMIDELANEVDRLRAREATAMAMLAELADHYESFLEGEYGNSIDDTLDAARALLTQE